jgi:hypothetical protein
MTGFVFSATASYASDIEIYQQARSGNISLMFVLDISGSMRYFDANNQELQVVVAQVKQRLPIILMVFLIIDVMSK